MTQPAASALHDRTIAFIGGGNIAGALIGGLRRQGLDASSIRVAEPFEEARARLLAQYGVAAAPAADAALLAGCDLVVWAIKPQTFRDVALAAGVLAPQALHLSVAAGIPSDSIATWLGNQRIVRAMPNTPALVGQGMTGLFARPSVTADDRALVDQALAPTGQTMWLETESQLDALTVLSGCGPAYVFYFIEAMVQAGTALGLTAQQAQQLAVVTFTGAAARSPPAR